MSFNIIITAPLPPPEVKINVVTTGMIAFSWGVTNSCSVLRYKIESDCGSCVNISYTASTNISCLIDTSSIATAADMCTFAVKSIVCGNITSNLSNIIEVMLKGNNNNYDGLYKTCSIDHIIISSSRITQNY